jgi:hypothetical protein
MTGHKAAECKQKPKIPVQTQPEPPQQLQNRKSAGSDGRKGEQEKAIKNKPAFVMQSDGKQQNASE